MKKQITIIAALCCHQLVIAQTITETFNPKVGNSYFTYLYNATTHNPGNAGINQVYDFSDIVSKASDGKLAYDGAATNPDPDAFPTSNVWSADFADNYTYFKAAANAYNVMGRDMNFEGSNAAMVYSDFETIKLPIKYNDLQIDKISGIAGFSSSGLPVKLHRNGVDSLKFDGYGTLKLDGKDKKVNRLKIVYNYTDSAKYISDIKRKNIVRKEEYLYIGIDEDFPTIILTKENKNSILQGSSSKSVTNTLIINSKSILTNISAQNTLGTTWKVWQNDDNNIVVEAKDENVMSVYNLQGQKLSECLIKKGNNIITNLSLSTQKGNILLVKMGSDNNFTTKKMLIE